MSQLTFAKAGKMRVLTQPIILIVLSILFSINLHAKIAYIGSPQTFAKPKSLAVSNEETLKLILHRYLTSRKLAQDKQYEIAVELKEERPFLRDTQVIMLRGRDINADGLMDIWFYTNESAQIVKIEKASNQTDGWDVIPQLLINNVKIKNRPFFKIFFNTMTSLASFGKANADSFMQKIMFEQMDIMTMESQVERLQKSGAHPAMVSKYYQIIMQSWDAVVIKINDKVIDVALLGMGEAALAGVGPRILGWIGERATLLSPKVMSYYGKLAQSGGTMAQKGAAKVSEYEHGLLVLKTLNTLKNGVQNVAKAQLAKISKKVAFLREKMAQKGLPITTPAAKAAAQVAKWTLEKETQIAVRSLNSQNIIEKMAYRSFIRAIELSKSNLNTVPYVLQSLGIQTGAEILARKEKLYRGDSAVVKEELFEMSQNLGYMSIENIMQASITNSISGVSRRMIICGFVSMVDSVLYNFALNGEPDTGRLKLDAGWEMTVSNLQTQLDMESIKYFEEQAVLRGNSKLKFVGYAFAFVDQFAGFLTYSAATQAVEANSKTNNSTSPTIEELRIIPVYSEQ